MMVFLLAAVSCGDDDGGSIIPDNNGEENTTPTYPVSAGRYVVNVGGDTTVTTTMELMPTITAKPGGGFGENDFRDGYSSVVTYLESGNYMFADISEDQTIARLHGGAVTNIDSAGAPVAGGWTQIEISEGGASFSIGSNGVYQVFFDQTYSTGFIIPIDNWYIHGDATEAGWGQDLSEWIEFSETSSTADGTTWSASGFVLRASEASSKFILPRYGFNIPFKDDLPVFTFFGGTVTPHTSADLSDTGGGDNLVWGEEGVYDATIELNGNDLTMSFTRTGDAPEVAYDPANFAWGVIGPAITGGWDTDLDLSYLDWADNWTGIFYLTEGEFTVRANDAWDVTINGGNAALESSSITVVGDGKQ